MSFALAFAGPSHEPTRLTDAAENYFLPISTSGFFFVWLDFFFFFHTSEWDFSEKHLLKGSSRGWDGADLVGWQDLVIPAMDVLLDPSTLGNCTILCFVTLGASTAREHSSCSTFLQIYCSY